MPRKYRLQVASDTIREIGRPTQPVAAVVELIWNSLDADATHVEVIIDKNPLGGPQVIRVIDNGHGMTQDEVVQEFQQLGGSWKNIRKLSKGKKRPLHGSHGRGRYRSLALGNLVEWSTVGAGVNGLERTRIRFEADSPEFEVSDPEVPSSGATGTSVIITSPGPATSQLLGSDASNSILVHLADYLARYPDIEVMYDGQLIDPASHIARQEEVELEIGETPAPRLTIREWQDDLIGFKSKLILCDENGIALQELAPEVSTGSLKLTGYLKWVGFDDRTNDLMLVGMGDEVLDPVVRAARHELAAYVRRREREGRETLLARWKAEKVYPYPKEPTNPAEDQEQRVFNAVAIVAADTGSLPTETKATRLSLRLIKEALERSPGSLHQVLEEVVGLSKEKLDDFAKLLQRTRLATIIEFTKTVGDRIQFLDDLQRLLFDPESEEQLKERKELHPLVENATWLFGEEYSLVVSDKGLTTLLKKHLHLLGSGDDEPVVDPVLDTNGKLGRRVDIVLSRSLEAQRARKNLVIELKRPSVVLGTKEHSQITEYAAAVAKDPRFASTDVSWDFWLVGNNYNDWMHDQAHQADRPEGVISLNRNYTVRVRRWAEILEENRQRLHFYQEHLQYQENEDASLKETLDRYLEQGAEVRQPRVSRTHRVPQPRGRRSVLN